MDEATWLGWIITAMAMAIATALVWEQLGYLRKASHLPGPGIVVPFLGNVASMVRSPAAFWRWQAAVAEARGGLSWNVLFGRFVVFIRDAELCHKVFANVRPDVFHLVGHPFGKKLFGEDNLIFMFGDRHKDLRRRLAPLFTTKALALYVSIQEKVIRKHVRSWLQQRSAAEQPLELRPLMRDLNLEASQDVFAGSYLDPQARAAFTRDYNLFNVGLMALPIDLPGFAFRSATSAVSRLVAALARAAVASRAAMSAPSPPPPACLLDVWMSEELASASDKPTSDKDAGQHVFDFLFAAQDASTSSLVWMAALLESHPHVLRRVRDEQRSIRAHKDEPISAEQLRAMKYTEMVAKEVVRFRPPAPLVPHIAAADFPITQDYTVPKGTIVFPSLLDSAMQGFSQPEKFDPDRFSPQRQEDVVYRRNWLMFGAGPHQCLGQRYAINQLMLFAAIFSMEAEWERVRTPGCDELAYVPTIIPKDGCLVKLRRRHRWESEEDNAVG